MSIFSATFVYADFRRSGDSASVYIRSRIRVKVGTGILPNNMRYPSRECYTTFLMITTYSDTNF